MLRYMIMTMIIMFSAVAAATATTIISAVVAIACHATEAAHDCPADGAAFMGNDVELLSCANHLSADVALRIGIGAND